MKRGTMMLLMQRNRRSDFDYPENREHYGVRYHIDRPYRDPRSYYDERIYGGEPEMRRYSNGRFAPRNSAEWPEYDEYPEMRQIGFRDGDTSYVGDRTHGTEKMQGYARGGGAKLNRQMAEKWVRGMKNADGSTGEHWTMDEASEIMRRHGYNCNPVKSWVAINAVYSDLCDTAQRHGVDNEDFYADMAKSFWLCDKDAVEDKLAAYYENVVRHN